jgi:small subunit ribosomal protein S5
LADYFRVTQHAGWQAANAKLAALELEQQTIRGRSPVTLVQREKKDSEPMAQVLFRGQYDKPKDKVGVATGKANDVSEAVRKAVEGARRNMVSIPLTGSTIPHEVVGQHGAGRVVMKPAAPGAGVIAGGAVRAVMECAGITDILTKSLGSTNPHNMVRAAFDGLMQLTTVEQIARERGVEVSAIGYRSRHKGKEVAHA